MPEALLSTPARGFHLISTPAVPARCRKYTNKQFALAGLDKWRALERSEVLSTAAQGGWTWHIPRGQGLTSAVKKRAAGGGHPAERPSAAYCFPRGI